MSPVRELIADRPKFVAFVRRRVSSGADAEDIVQQALLKATEHVGDVQDRDRIRAWFFRILRRTMADDRDRQSLQRAKLGALARELDLCAAPAPTTCTCSVAELARLRAEYAEMLRRVDIEEQSIEEAARALGITVNNASVRLYRARTQLRKQLFARCKTTSVRACVDCPCDAGPPRSRSRG